MWESIVFGSEVQSSPSINSSLLFSFVIVSVNYSLIFGVGLSSQSCQRNTNILPFLNVLNITLTTIQIRGFFLIFFFTNDFSIGSIVLMLIIPFFAFEKEPTELHFKASKKKVSFMKMFIFFF
jgi:hypothetical protein